MAHSYGQETGLLPLPAEERSMFVTFSKGYPVSERELRNFLTEKYGNCIDSIYVQTLFARIVFFSPSTIDEILDGADKAKFMVNRKDVWMRKYQPRKQRISPVGQCPQRRTSYLTLLKSFAVRCANLVCSCFQPAAN